ncbi:nucleoside diphosphate kinase [Bisgaardia hudsonensis]|uniref:Nucleoside diphosphate kinase n=1 Tax=Bisgaardia hudsonensis TaxID=109472 RepID=A0A4R2MYG4_9PAST|nr:nucleoside-diphosphate kinase [Bisgaardia hudsonensis]QLB13548.1 nucleoside-diphosphate kinase [Bisgaardia hudsonensis]TCP11172.1 nucleoside diphosphate kinase [Bisgaardia hudsonensis]
MLQKTLSIIKPDAVKRNLIGRIFTRLEDNGFQIVATKMLHLTKEQAEGFYAEHKEREFFNDLVDYMISAPVVVSVLERENAIKNYRTLMGTTNPAEAEVGTIRGEFGLSLRHNSVHGSDSLESAEREIAFFFSEAEILNR